MRLLAFTAALLLLASPAFAHAFLQKASPPVSSVVTASPPQIAIKFSEGIEPLFSSIELRDANGGAVMTGKPHTAPGDTRTLVVELPKLPSGTYVVSWHVTSVDTHRTEGSYQIHIAATGHE